MLLLLFGRYWTLHIVTASVTNLLLFLNFIALSALANIVGLEHKMSIVRLLLTSIL